MCPGRHVGYGFTSLVPRLILFSVHQKENWKCFDTCIAKLSCYHFILSFWNVSLSAMSLNLANTSWECTPWVGCLVMIRCRVMNWAESLSSKNSLCKRGACPTAVLPLQYTTEWVTKPCPSFAVYVVLNCRMWNEKTYASLWLHDFWEGTQCPWALVSSSVKWRCTYLKRL